ncbi:MAG: DUF881 domain-containing protein [Egibacteraceae bacterium]
MSELARALGLEPDTESDYRPREPTRWSQPWSVVTVRALTAAGALVVGFLVATGFVAGHQTVLAQDARKGQLIALVGARQERAEALSQQLDKLRVQVAEAERTTASVGSGALQGQLRRTEAVAGLTPLRGPGVRLTFSDGTGECTTGRAEDCRIQDVDLQLATNTLFALGAEGVAINGERLIATTAIRSAGSSILVNYRVLFSPYVIEAVGDAQALSDGFDDSTLAQDFTYWKDTYNLGLTSATIEELVLPGYSGAVRVDGVPPEAGGGG